ncbi:cytochrome P450 [Coniochaeta sp. 2T2.1]|nr:cytochrome P450 [Coniochaeta sp. 2T2.1]
MFRGAAWLWLSSTSLLSEKHILISLGISKKPRTMAVTRLGQLLLQNSIFCIKWLAIISVVITILYFIYDSHTAGLRHVPGPFIARYTNLHAFISTWRAGRRGDYLLGMHEKYGGVVRVGPRMVSVADTDAINTIYNTKLRLNKSESVTVGVPFGRTSPNIATMRDTQVHGQFRRPIANAYALSTLVEYEPRVDDTLRSLFVALDREGAGGARIDIARWAFYYALDVIGELSFGKPIGFLEQGRDVYGLIYKQSVMTNYVRLLTTMPKLHYLLLGNPILGLFIDPSKNTFYRFSQERVQERISEFEQPPTKRDTESGRSGPRKPDLLAYFLDSREKYPDIMTEEQVVSTVITNIFSGGLATNALYLIVHHFVTHPAAQKRLLDEMTASGVTYPVTWTQTQKLPFLNGLIRESTRLHLALNCIMGRDVPPEGLILPNGMRLPPGTAVGVKAHCCHGQEQIFGEGPLEFRPERWCRGDGEGEEEYEARMSRMERGDMSFGYGARVCIGQNVARLQMFKVVANLVYKYELLPAGDIGDAAKREVFCSLRRRTD